MLLSGTIMEIGRNIDFKLSGNSVRPAYPGFIVIKIPQVLTNAISIPSKINRATFCDKADKIERICCATTESTSMLILYKCK
jgi:hypothetical protein